MRTIKVDVTDGFFLAGRPRRQIDVELPEGFRRVFRGAVLPGDKFLNIVLARDNVIVWEDANPDELIGTHYKMAEYYTCLIRHGIDGPDKPCERCGSEMAVPGERFCEFCRMEIIRKGRAKA